MLPAVYKAKRKPLAQGTLSPMSASSTAENVSNALAHLEIIKDGDVFPVLLETFLFGILTILFLASTYILNSRGLHSRPRLLMFILTLTMYALAGTLWAFGVYAVWVDLSISIPFDLAGGDGPAPGDHIPYTNFAEEVLGATTSVLWEVT
ncbi:hypothetical protein OF83DRAFT_1110173 [Amylostereum chailletii]|nr:hypothetical protein OF83DRAFT_1110173 [Amylostereum chailletii]